MASTPLLPRRRRTRLSQPWRWLPFAVRLQIARIRNRSIRYRLARRIVVVAVLAGMLVVWAQTVSSADRARQQWGVDVHVVVVTEALRAGDVIDASVSRRVTLPSIAVPIDALATIADDASTRNAMSPGDVVRARDLATNDSGVPDGHRALALPMSPLVPQLQAGDRVELFLHAGSGDRPAAVDGVVLQANPEVLLLAVDEQSAGAVAGALGTGQIVVAAA